MKQPAISSTVSGVASMDRQDDNMEMSYGLEIDNGQKFDPNHELTARHVSEGEVSDVERMD